MRDRLKTTRRVEAGGEFVGERLVVDKAVFASQSDGVLIECFRSSIASVCCRASSASVNSPAQYCFSVELIFNHFTLTVRSTDG
jgi:hypothetical protein